MSWKFNSLLQLLQSHNINYVLFRRHDNILMQSRSKLWILGAFQPVSKRIRKVNSAVFIYTIYQIVFVYLESKHLINTTKYVRCVFSCFFYCWWYILSHVLSNYPLFVYVQVGANWNMATPQIASRFKWRMSSAYTQKGARSSKPQKNSSPHRLRSIMRSGLCSITESTIWLWVFLMRRFNILQFYIFYFW